MPHASRTPAEAVEHYRGQIVRLLSCGPAPTPPSAATTPPICRTACRSPTATLCDCGEPRLTLDATEQYRVHEDAEGWHVEIVGYLYAIGYEGRELVAYHWHPHGDSPITRPHMHVGTDIRVGDRWLGKVHLPTGAVSLDRIVALAIADLGAEPLRDDWERLIGEAAVR